MQFSSPKPSLRFTLTPGLGARQAIVLCPARTGVLGGLGLCIIAPSPRIDTSLVGEGERPCVLS